MLTLFHSKVGQTTPVAKKHDGWLGSKREGVLFTIIFSFLAGLFASDFVSSWRTSLHHRSPTTLAVVLLLAVIYARQALKD